ncbi:MAG: hypothetical protein DLM65_07725 [Candidatus Aeolococcus gillhamiae]|uniref:PLL-like beta propeller domain-containing protein n=1 Tax=Candidatus Aeolococcus gillhamiae TaxID=3127015 RepID=A0A2W6A5I3_9BACT|nr:MAG: hypothetical protein DLM65_07725 [Candidatus Dormibacter sp. RRmetagenome_bin12]
MAVTPDGSQQLVFWKSTTTSQLNEAWFAQGSWHGPISFPQLGALTSTPAVAVTKDGSTQLVFWQGPGGHLFEAWFSGSWNGPVDITGAALNGQGALASAPSVVTTKDGSQLVFWRGSDGHFGEAWYSAGGWHGPVDFAGLGSLASAPSATITPDGSTQLVFFQGLDNHLNEDWFTLNAWHGPIDLTSLGTLASSPSVAVTPDSSTQIVFFRSPAGHLQEDWFTQGSWHGPADITASRGGAGLLASPPSATITTDGSTQLVFWQGAGSTLWEGWYAGGGWNGPIDLTPGPPVTFGDGTWHVGSQIPAGTYRTRQAASGCYWERLSGFGGTSGEIIANHFGDGYQVVTISPSDAGFHTESCGAWTSDLSATGAWPAQNGIFIVGTDLASGTYSAPGGSSCYWARLSGFGGTSDQIIANGLGQSSVIVTVAPGDAGFEASGCGIWSGP